MQHGLEAASANTSFGCRADVAVSGAMARSKMQMEPEAQSYYRFTMTIRPNKTRRECKIGPRLETAGHLRVSARTAQAFSRAEPQTGLST